MNLLFKRSIFNGDISGWVYHPECMGADAFSCYHPSVLGMLALYRNDFKLPPDHPMAPRYTELAHIANGLGMPEMLAAQYIYNEMYQKTSLDVAVNLPVNTSWMNEAPHD